MYEQIIKESFAKFKGDESVMWASIKLVNNTLQKIKEENPSLYWGFMRDAHEIMQGKHYNEAYAKWEVEQMHHKSPDGTIHRGEHWTKEQTNNVMMKYKAMLPAEITPCDFYVALNSQWHDYICWAKARFESDKEAEEAIIEGAVVFWFKDDDYPTNDKVWCYSRGKNK